MTDARRIWCWVLLFGCNDVVLDPHHPEPAVVPARSGDLLTPSRAPKQLPAPACIKASATHVSFGDVVPGRTQRRTVELHGCAARGVEITALDLEGDGFDLVSELVRAPTGDDAARIEIEFRPLVSGHAYAGRLVVHTDDPRRPRIEVALGGHGGWAVNACAPWTAVVDGTRAPALAAPGDQLLLDARAPPTIDPKGALVRWTVVARPAGSVTQPVERDAEPDAAETPTALFLIDLPGRYGFEAAITPPAASGCPPQAVRIYTEACPCPGDLQVQLVWDVAADAPPPARETPTDLDLHLLHPAGDAWDHPALSCSAQRPTQPWDDPGSAEDDPVHDADASRAPGVENVLLDRLGRRDGLYRIGVLQRRPYEWHATASVRVFLDDRLAWESTNRRLGDGHAFWDVAGVGWSEGRLVVVPIDRLFLTGGDFPPPDYPLLPGSPCLPERSPACGADLRCAIQPGADHGRCTTEGR